MMKLKILFRALIIILTFFLIPCSAQKPDVIFDLEEKIQLLAFSDSEKMLAVETSDDFIIYDIVTGKPQKQFEEFNGFANSAIFSRDGKILISGNNGGKVKLFDTATLSLLKIFPVSQWSIYALAISQDNQLVAVDAADGTVQLWNINGGENSQTLGDEGGRIKFMSFSPNDEFLAATTIDYKLSLFNVKTSKKIFTVQRSTTDSPIVFCQQGEELAISNLDSIDFLDVKNGELKHSVKLPKENTPFTAHSKGGYFHGRIIISPDCQTLAVSDWKNKTITLMNVKTNKVKKTLDASDSDETNYTIVFSPNMQFIAAGSTNGKVRLWRLK